MQLNQRIISTVYSVSCRTDGLTIHEINGMISLGKYRIINKQIRYYLKQYNKNTIIIGNTLMKEMAKKRNQSRITNKKITILDDSVFYLLTKGKSRKWINFEAMDAELLHLVMLYEKEMQGKAEQQQKDEGKDKVKDEHEDEDKQKGEMDESETKEQQQDDKPSYEPYQIKINQIRKAAKLQAASTPTPPASTTTATTTTTTTNASNQTLIQPTTMMTQMSPKVKNMLFLNELEGQLFFKVYFENGHEQIINNKRMRVAFPQQLISFYENNIQISNNTGDTSNSAKVEPIK